MRNNIYTALDIGSSKISDSDFQKILDSRNRSEAGLSVPSAGLFLTNITYPQKFIKTWKK